MRLSIFVPLTLGVASLIAVLAALYVGNLGMTLVALGFASAIGSMAFRRLEPAEPERRWDPDVEMLIHLARDRAVWPFPGPALAAIGVALVVAGVIVEFA